MLLGNAEDRLKIDEFSYSLPDKLIAQYPLEHREEARLLVLDRKAQTIRHHHFYEIGSFLKKDDILVLNNTKVFKARIQGRKETGGRFEALLVKEVQKGIWEALVHTSKRLKIGAKVILGEGLFCIIRDKAPGRSYLEFNRKAEEVLEKIGSVPLPHYIKRATIPADEQGYQTVYAEKIGSIAAPTAGLHFTKELLKDLEEAGIQIVYITLHIGPGTFKPIRVSDIEKHTMESESFEISAEAAEKINNARRVIAVGTSVTRSLETAANYRGAIHHTKDLVTEPAQQKRKLSPFSGATDLFIYPGYKFKIVDALITNFHLPSSTPLLLVCAFAGKELTFRAYNEAIVQSYRFLSYGDSMLII